MSSDVFSYALENISMLIINEKEGQMLSGKTTQEDIINTIIEKYPDGKVRTDTWRRVGLCMLMVPGGLLFTDVNGQLLMQLEQEMHLLGICLQVFKKKRSLNTVCLLQTKRQLLSVTRKGATASIPS